MPRERKCVECDEVYYDRFHSDFCSDECFEKWEEGREEENDD